MLVRVLAAVFLSALKLPNFHRVASSLSGGLCWRIAKRMRIMSVAKCSPMGRLAGLPLKRTP